jgi:hypothetical protein
MVRPRSSRRRAQTSIYETDLTESQPELLAALKTREERKETLSTAKQNFETANGVVDPLIAKLELGEDAAVRVGDFVITSKKSKQADVSFTRQASTRIRIRKLDE